MEFIDEKYLIERGYEKSEEIHFGTMQTVFKRTINNRQAIIRYHSMMNGVFVSYDTTFIETPEDLTHFEKMYLYNDKEYRNNYIKTLGHKKNPLLPRKLKFRNGA